MLTLFENFFHTFFLFIFFINKKNVFHNSLICNDANKSLYYLKNKKIIEIFYN